MELNHEVISSVLEQINELFFRADIQGNLVMVSQSSAGLLGYDSVDFAASKPLLQFWYDLSEREALMNDLKQSGEARDRRVRSRPSHDIHDRRIAQEICEKITAGSGWRPKQRAKVSRSMTSGQVICTSARRYIRCSVLKIKRSFCAGWNLKYLGQSPAFLL